MARGTQMRRRYRWLMSIGAGALALAAVAFAVQPAVAQMTGEEAVAFPEGRFNSSAVCGACHKDIYTAWSEGSIHSRSMMDVNFQSAISHIDVDEQENCLMCHAPTTVVTQDKALALSLTHEGITCDFCHSLKDVRLGEPIPFVLDLGPRKRGPLKDARMAPHETVASPLHTSSLLCASCHEYTNAHGVKVLSTYSDWQAGPYPARKVECQGCHMEVYKGDLVVNQKTDKISRKFINLHQVPGGRSLNQLRRALELSIDKVRSKDGQTVVDVIVSNRSAGHKIPGGFANRQIRLEVAIQTPERRTTRERTFRQVLTDANGKALHQVVDLIGSAVNVRSDTRLNPEERRNERFLFPPASKGAKLMARLVYEVEPAWPGDGGRTVEVWRVKRDL